MAILVKWQLVPTKEKGHSITWSPPHLWTPCGLDGGIATEQWYSHCRVNRWCLVIKWSKTQLIVSCRYSIGPHCIAMIQMPALWCKRLHDAGLGESKCHPASAWWAAKLNCNGHHGVIGQKMLWKMMCTRCVIDVCDYSKQYPETVALRSIPASFANKTSILANG